MNHVKHINFSPNLKDNVRLRIGTSHLSLTSTSPWIDTESMVVKVLFGPIGWALLLRATWKLGGIVWVEIELFNGLGLVVFRMVTDSWADW